MEASGQQSRATRAIGLGAAALFVALTTVYALSPVVNVGDARYTGLLAGRAPALALAAAIRLGTPAWSTFSRALSNHGAGVLVASLAVAELAAAADTRRAPRAALLASLFGVGLFARPTAAAPELLVGPYRCERRRARLPAARSLARAEERGPRRARGGAAPRRPPRLQRLLPRLLNECKALLGLQVWHALQRPGSGRRPKVRRRRHRGVIPFRHVGDSSPTKSPGGALRTGEALRRSRRES